MTDLNQANAHKMENELVTPHLRLVRDAHARSQIQRDANDLLKELCERDTDDLEFGYQVRNKIIKMFMDHGVELRGGTGNLFAEVRGNSARLDLGLDERGIPRLRDYDV
jgi:hypothetical protein